MSGLRNRQEVAYAVICHGNSHPRDGLEDFNTIKELLANLGNIFQPASIDNIMDFKGEARKPSVDRL